MRLREAPYTEFRRVPTSLDDYASVDSSPLFLINNIPMMDMELKENDLMELSEACTVMVSNAERKERTRKQS